MCTSVSAIPKFRRQAVPKVKRQNTDVSSDSAVVTDATGSVPPLLYTAFTGDNAAMCVCVPVPRTTVQPSCSCPATTTTTVTVSSISTGVSLITVSTAVSTWSISANSILISKRHRL